MGNTWRPNLADPNVRVRLKPRAAAYFNLISYCRHIGLHKADEGFASWVARVRKKDGGYRQQRIGYAVFAGEDLINHDQALERALAWFNSKDVLAVASEAYQLGSKRELNFCPIGIDYTVGHALLDYINWKRIAATKSHFETIISMANYHIVPRISHVLLADFNGAHFQKFAMDVLETQPKVGKRKVGPRRQIRQLSEEELRKRKKTLNSLISILRGAFEIAWEHGHIDSDRPRRCLRRLPNVDRPRVIFLNRRDCRQLIDACPPDLGNLVLGALYTGCRANELTSMRVSDVGGQINGVYVASPKGHKSRHVFLPEEGMKFFLELTKGKHASDRVFQRTDGRAWGGEYKSYFQIARRKAGLSEKLVFHGLRHTYASQLIQAGTSLLVVADQLGHANTQTISSTYGHLAPQFRESEVSARFEPIFEPSGGPVTKPKVSANSSAPSLSPPEQESSWPRSNHSRLSGRLLEELVRHRDK